MNIAPEEVLVGVARDRAKASANTTLDPTQRALELMADHGLKLVRPRPRTAPQTKFALSGRLAFLKARLLLAQARYLMCRGLCRIIGEPKQPSVKSN